jgi:hypothetical protein
MGLSVFARGFLLNRKGRTSEAMRDSAIGRKEREFLTSLIVIIKN